jgi:hypothetical protein
MRYLLFLITGLLLLGASLYKLKISIDFASKSRRAIGVVSSIIKDDGAYYPVFTVDTKQNSKVTYRYHSGSNPASWTVGERALFLYDPHQPSDVRLMTYVDLFGWSIVFVVLAMPLIIIGGGYYLLNPKRHFPKKTVI